ncbi:DNA ligase D [Halobacillus fulvus]|nr:DNA ligase D [Halobacillus fulvus]
MRIMKPMRLTLANDAPMGKDWTYEVKYDGFRTLLYWSEEGIHLISRNEKDLTDRFPEITALAETINPPKLPLLLDGELVVLNTPYQANFPLLQQRGRLRNKTKINDIATSRPVTFVAFDILLDPKWKLNKRRQVLKDVIKKLPTNRIQLIESFTKAEDVKAIVHTHQGEGIVAKKKDSFYQEDIRSKDWQKVKNWRTISGFLTHFDPSNDYFQLAIMEDAETTTIGKFKHGLDAEQHETLRSFFKNKGTKTEGGWNLGPGVCVDVHCLHAENGELREPVFHEFRFDLSHDECTKEKLEWDLSLFPENVTFTNLDKALWPGVTKREYLLYLRDIAPYLLPHLLNKKLTLIRFPDGIDKPSFFQKHASSSQPSFVETWPENDEEFLLCSGLESLLWFGNQGALEFHIPFQKVKEQQPTDIVFDLDPPDRDAFSLAIKAAQLFKQLLDELDVRSFIKTSGNKGMQLHIPILGGSMSYEETRGFTESLAALLVRQHPESFTTERLKKKRGKRLYIDYVQHAEGKTIIAPYSARATEKATIAAPLYWNEVTENLHPDQFTLQNTLKRVQTYGCPFSDYGQARLHQPIETMKSLKD